MAGFGRSSFGSGPFGKSDTGGDLVVQSFPVQYFSESDITTDPLFKLIKVYANSVNKRRSDIDAMPEMIDFEKAPLDILDLLGGLFGLDIDKNEPEFLQRSFVANASQWLQLKASTKGYEIRGLASGFNVEVDNFWKIDPLTVAPFIPLRFQYNIKSQYADPSAPTYLYTDKPPGTFPGTPTQEGPSYAKSSFIRVVFTIPPNSPVLTQPGVDYNNLLNLIIDKIHDVVGIHQELTENQFLRDIEINETMSVQHTESMENIQIFNFNEANYYDIIPGDVVACDGGLGITMQITP